MKMSNKIKGFSIYSALAVGILIIFFPLYLTIVTALKIPAESAKNFFALPSSFLAILKRYSVVPILELM